MSQPRENWGRGRAVGGPQDGVLLEAPLSWDGRARRPSSRKNALIRYYPGRYVWNAGDGTWVWEPGEEHPPETKPRTQHALNELNRWYNR